MAKAHTQGVKKTPGKKTAAKKPAVKNIKNAAVKKKQPVAKKKAAPIKAAAKKSAAPKKVAAKKMAPIKTPAEKKKPTSNKAAVSKKKVYISPDIYRSILDEPQIDGPAYRYSDEELNEFKEIIMSKMDIARKEVHYLQGLLQNHSDGGATSRNGDINGTDLAVSNSEKEQLTLLASRQLQLINHLEKALVRIENKTYGICRVTGKMIDKARLRAVPHATLSIEAKKTQYSTRV